MKKAMSTVGVDAKPGSGSGSGLGWRHVQLFAMFLAACTAITMRVCLSVAIVVMTGPDQGDGYPRFSWTPAEKSGVLGSFLWGYMVSQVAGGFLSSRGWSILVLVVTISSSGLVTASLPFVAAAGGAGAVTALRVLTGLLQGVLYPTMFTLLGRWAPPEERSRAGSVVLASQPIGNVLAMALSGWISYAWGWPTVFYIFGVSGVTAALVLYVLGADSPDAHTRISQEERDYLSQTVEHVEKAKLPVPWRAMLTSPALWSLLAAQLGYLWGYWVIITCTPSYINNLMQVGIEWNGLLSAAPQLSMAFCSVLFGWLSDLVTTRRLLSPTHNRKLFNAIGEWGPGVLCILVGALGPTNPPLAVGLLVVACGLIAATFSGSLINFVDIAPNFGGIVFGIANTVGSFVSAFAPYAEGVFVDREDPMPGWSNVFYSSAAAYLVLNSVWMVCGTAKVQPWNNPISVSKP
ncbi:Putative inorganic phosphate cotransporter [Frankliniella fusca]|uniref:Inorganic phosphate cotransporter n=1 Tax=Frankliniella fusca TaxID=407009 RepID=A0AAE1L5G6_9NEOP|nr:Putative inorganic phosphate cotransporter [Frankliniella fusca]